jgi:hypothetical protein
MDSSPSQATQGYTRRGDEALRRLYLIVSKAPTACRTTGVTLQTFLQKRISSVALLGNPRRQTDHLYIRGYRVRTAPIEERIRAILVRQERKVLRTLSVRTAKLTATLPWVFEPYA